jgi:hypothetical protein
MARDCAFRVLGARSAALLAVAALLVTGLLATSEPAGARASTNPLAGGALGVYTGAADGVYPAWQSAGGTTKRLLGKVALKPRVRWFGSWIRRGDVRGMVHDYIVQTQNGDPRVLVQMAVFRLWPKGEGHKSDPLSSADQSAYRAWIDAAARGVGRARVALILEPDLPVAFNGWRPAVRFALTRYAARAFGALPNTSVYIDGGSSDWLTAAKAASLLRASGVRYARGFALNATHYTSTSSNITHGRAVTSALARLGLPGKHFVVNTADTGRPFTWPQYWRKHPYGNFDNAETCQNRSERYCVTLGIPPTRDVAASAWHFSATVNRIARTWCDAFLWYGRPWLRNQASPFDLQRTLQIARTTPY